MYLGTMVQQISFPLNSAEAKPPVEEPLLRRCTKASSYKRPTTMLQSVHSCTLAMLSWQFIGAGRIVKVFVEAHEIIVISLNNGGKFSVGH